MMTELLNALKLSTGSYQKNIDPKMNNVDPVIRLLIVDDNPDDRELLRRMLTRFKSRFQLIEAETGAAALKICLENPPDCVLLDYHLPDFEAPDFLAELGGDDLLWCPVVVITGLTDGLSGTDLIRQGAQDFIGKNWINQESLERAIENAIERYKMLCKLQDKKHLLSATQRNAHIGSWAWYSDEKIVWSDETYRIWGVSPDTFTPTSQALQRLVYPDDWFKFQACFGGCFAEKCCSEIIIRHLMPDGSLRYLQTRRELNYNPGLKELLLQGTMQDVTERTLAQIKLKDSEERLLLALDAARLGVFDWDMVLNRVVWSARQEDLWGFKSGEFDGPYTYAHFSSRVHADDLQGIEDEVVRCITTRDTFKQQFRVVRLDGAEIWVLGLAKLFFDDVGQPLRMTGTSEDITARKRSEALLLEAETTRIAAHYARNLIETNLDSLVTLSRDGKITDANTAAETAFECAKNELIGSDFAGYFTEPEAALDLYQQVFKTGTVHNHALNLRHTEGQAMPVLYNATLYRDDAGEVLGAVAVARDITDLVKIEKALIKTESYFKTLFNKAPLGIVVVNSLTGQLLSANPMFAKIVGKSLEETLTIDWMRITHPDDVRKNLDNMVLMNTGQIPGFTMEKRYLKPDGTITWINLTVTPIEVSDKSSPRHIAIIEDITQRKLQEQLILNESEKNKVLLNAASDGIHILDEQGYVVDFSASFADILGYSVEETARLNVVDWDTQIPAEQLPVMIKQLLKHPAVFETRHRRKDGSVIDVEINAKGIELSDKCYLYASSRDITERKILFKQIALYEAIVRSSEDAIISKSLDGIITSWNKGAEVIFGYTAEEMIGSCMLRLFPQDKLCEYCFDKVLYYKQLFTHQATHRLRKDGVIIEVSISVSPIYDEADQVMGISKIVRDITHQKQLERELIKAKLTAEAASKSKGEFLANMSHEIRTPMNAILGLTRLASETELTPKQQNYLSKIQGASQSLLNILNDILDISKIESGRLDIECIEFEIVSVLQSVIDLFIVSAENKGLEIFLDIAPEVPLTALGDPLRIRQVLCNLLSNAIKFTTTGYIQIHIDRVENHADSSLLRFSVQDTGMGIDAAGIERLFQPFSQADNSITRKFGGTGLGLVISKQLVQLMDGDFEMTSEPGQGTTFSFTIRCGKGQPYNWLEDSEHLKELRVLVVDDQEKSCTLLKKTLVSWQVFAETALSAELGLQKIDAAEQAGTPFGLLLVDWQMQGMNGLEFVKVLERKSQNTLQKMPVIMMVTDAGKEALQKLTAEQPVSINAILTKPVEASNLLNNILHVCHYQGKTYNLKNTPIDPYLIARPLYNRHILLVEDNALNQQVASEFLMKAGMRISIANNGAEAVECVQKEQFDAVLMDLQMPVMDGFEATRHIRQLIDANKLPIIAMTAATMENDKGICLEIGMNDHVAKPINPLALINTLLRWVEPNTSAPEVLHKTVNHASWSELAAKLPGFDVDDIMLTLSGDEAQFFELLVEFQELFVIEVPAMLAMIEAGELPEAEKQVHLLKGVAGNLGMTELLKVTTELDSQLRNGHYESETLANWVTIFDKTMATIVEALSQGAPEMGSQQSDTMLADVFTELETLLKENKVITKDLLTQFQTLLPSGQEGIYAVMNQHIVDNDYPKANAILNVFAMFIK